MPDPQITTFTNEELRASAPTGRTQRASDAPIMEIEHPKYGLRWVRRTDWAEAHPRPRKTRLSGASKAVRGRRRSW